MLSALQTLIDGEVLTDETVKAILTGIMEKSEDDDDKRRAAFLLWSRDSGNKEIPDDVTISNHDDCVVECGRAEYLVLTDDEADARCADQIKESLWAFNASFLSGMTGIDDEVFSALSEKCEGANEPIASIIRGTCGIDKFVERAASADGRGHFLASYDSEESDWGDYYIYRTN